MAGDFPITSITNVMNLVHTTSTYIGYVNGYTTKTYYYSYSEPTYRRKEETPKERRIREAQAFRCFQKSNHFTPKPIKSIFVEAENIESSKRIDKFKSKSNNLIGMEIKPIFK